MYQSKNNSESKLGLLRWSVVWLGIFSIFAFGFVFPFYRNYVNIKQLSSICEQINLMPGNVESNLPKGFHKLLSSWLGEDGMIALKGVRSCVLNQYAIEDEDLELLANRDDLIYLEIRGRTLTQKGLLKLRGLTSLSVLKVGGTLFDDQCLENFTTCRDLESIDLTKTLVTESGLANLARIKGLERLVVRGLKVSYIDLNSNPKLTTLDLSQTSVNDQTLEQIGKLKELKHVDLGQLDITDSQLKYFSSNTNLRTLDLSGSSVSDAGMKSLSRLTKLKELVISSPNFSGEGLSYLDSAKGLLFLELNYCKQLNDESLVHLSQFPKLISFQAGNSAISDEGLEHLRTVKTLKRVELWSTNVTRAGIQKFQDDCKDCDAHGYPSIR